MTDLRAPSAPSRMRTRLVVQGEYEATADRDLELSTLLGSCVATCLCDPSAGVGGMNHFLLASGEGATGLNERYGTFAMEVLINALLKLGARKSRLEAKLFGGATMAGRMGRIGAANCAFAKAFLETENIRLLSSSLGGDRARRLRYVPATGLARMLFVQEDPPQVEPPRRPKVRDTGDVTLF